MNTDLSTLIAPPDGPNVSTIEAKPNAHPEPTDEIKLEAILSVAELMEKGTRSPTAIQGFLAANYGLTSRNTATKYRNLAMTLIARENKPMNRENIRHLEVGRLTWWIERLTNKIKDYEDGRPEPCDDDYLKWHDTYAKMLSKLNDYGARLHAITGLNEITVNNADDRKRVIFMRPGEATTVTPTVEIRDIIEADVVAPNTTT